MLLPLWDELVPGWLERGSVAQAVALGLATLLQEDLPTVGAATLAASGRLSGWTAWLGCFLGIWLGDVLLYWAARVFGRRWMEFRVVRRWVSAESVRRSEVWFARRGAWLLVTSRVVPGLRLPTFLAAGLLRQPFGLFLAVTGVMVLVWTAAIFGLAFIANTGWLVWGGQRPVGLLPGFVVFVAVLGAAWVMPRLWVRLPWRRWALSLGRWRHWEFWPAGLFYVPVALNALRLAAKYRGLTLPTAANPGIPTGGMVGESKWALLRDLFAVCPEATAEAWFVAAGGSGKRRRELAAILEANRVGFPFILKPDVGQRGMGVKRIECWSEAEAYLSTTEAPLVVQRYVPGPLEAGVFYYRFPGEHRGRIFSITEKVFPVVTGDGCRTVAELIEQDARARWMAELYGCRLGERRRRVPAAGERVPLVFAGNHAQGCIFRDGARWWTPELEGRIDAVSRALPGFFIGRFDVRFASEEEFRSGSGFQIVELNGASAEATHIYDARYSLRQAYATLFRQWELVFAIGAANRAAGAPTTSALDLFRNWRRANQLAATYPLAD